MEKLLNMTMGQLIDRTAENFPDNDAVLYTHLPFRKTFKEFRELINLTAKGFHAMGIKKGDKVAIWATNTPEWLLTLFGTAKLGAILVTVNTNYKIYEAEYLLRQSDAKALVLIDGFKDCNYVDIIKELCPTLKTAKKGQLNEPGLPFLKSVIYAGENNHDGMFNWNDLYELAKTVTDKELEEIENSLDPNEVINMQYTSGTTGFPKGVMLTHNNIINNGKSIGDNMNLTEKDSLCLPVPFFHCFGLVLGILAAFTHNTTIVPLLYYQPLKVMESVEKEKCTALHGVPTMFIGILEHPEFDNFDFSHLRTGIMAGSPCPISVMKQVVEKMHMNEITIAYGLTEASPVCTQTNANDSIERRVSTVGKVMPFIEAKVVDPETGEDLPFNTPGEFVAKGYNIMKGYYKMPEATTMMIDDDGWLHSGDLATMDEEGYFKITGRIKDMIIRGGENIYPKEIEEFIYTHPSVKDVQVVGVPDSSRGEEVMAYVILKENQNLTVDELKEFVKSNMARHKVPKYIGFIDQFPMTASGKIQKYKLRELAIESLKLQDAADIETA